MKQRQQSNNQLLTLDAEAISTMYHHEFSKKKAISTGQELVKQVFEVGEVEPLKVFSNIVRLKEVVNAADKAFRERLHLAGKHNVNGVSFQEKNGSKKLNYSEDPIYAELVAKVKAREELLKSVASQTEPVYDSEGIEIPKVSVTYDKSSITVTF